MDKLSYLLSDYRTGGIIFTLVYIFGTMIIPNIYMSYFGIFKKMNHLSLFIWISIQILWQLIIIYSIYIYLDGMTDKENINNIDRYTYDLFVEGGWHNFQKWLSYYAEDVWGDIILLSFIFILPIGIFDTMDGKDKIQFIFTKIGLFFVFLFFILGPPVYNISVKETTLKSYLDNTLKFKGDPDKVGYLSYIYNNKSIIIRIIISLILLIYILFRGKRLSIKYKERKIKQK